ncbi:unnamed protein product [Orchesella dallaii]|uniref:RNA exonuclease 4 n=1 Tax=Orchesella dallaii TaxID=48710 RepID=A0ABP1Q2A0_9HEXA
MSAEKNRAGACYPSVAVPCLRECTPSPSEREDGKTPVKVVTPPSQTKLLKRKKKKVRHGKDSSAVGSGDLKALTEIAEGQSGGNRKTAVAKPKTKPLCEGYKELTSAVTTSSVGGKGSEHPGSTEVVGSAPAPKKSRSRKKKKKTSESCALIPIDSIVADNGNPVAKIPISRGDSSSNWKALLEAQGKPKPAKKKKKKPTTESSASNNSNVAACATDKGIDKPSATPVQGSSLSSAKKAKGKTEDSSASTASATAILKKLPGEGLNAFGFFNYSHYGTLQTSILPAHHEFMQDTGIIAMDCEMVGVGPMMESALARVSIVNEYGYCLYDKFVKPKLKVTDFRTKYSGIREADLRNATPFELVGKEVARLLKSHILIGHSLEYDLAVLFLTHPKARTRDTAVYFKKVLHQRLTPALRTLVKKILGVQIQEGEHSSIVDAQATMALYRVCQKDWELSVCQKNRGVDILRQALDEFKVLVSPVP